MNTKLKKRMAEISPHYLKFLLLLIDSGSYAILL